MGQQRKTQDEKVEEGMAVLFVSFQDMALDLCLDLLFYRSSWGVR